jgi:hypothetical protein
MALPTIGTLWIGPELGWMEQLCLKSFLDHGHEVVLYTYDKVKNVPKGVRMADANDVLPSDNIIRHANTGSPAYHADIFRLHMLQQTDNIWADTDAFCCQPWDIKRGKHFHGWISDKKPQVNNGVLRLPKTSKTLKAMLEFTSDEYPIPPWLKENERAELQALKDKGQGVHVSLMPWGVWGPDALTWFLNDTGEIKYSQDKHVIYPVPFSTGRYLLIPGRVEDVRAMIKEDTLSIHFWGRRFRNILAKRFGGVLADGCYADELCKRHNITPVPVAAAKKPVEPDLLDLPDIVKALDLDDVASLADINGGAPDLAIELHNRYGTRVDVLCMDSDGNFAEPDRAIRAYQDELQKAGVDKSAIRLVTKRKMLKTYDVIASIGNFGTRYKIKHIKPLLDKSLHPLSRLVIDIKKGSGTYPFLKEYGGSNTLVPATGDEPALAVMSVEPRTEPVGEWSKIATKLAGKDGFFTDCGEHSFLYMPRGDTLVVTFDNLDIAMTKRDDRRPWGFSFIESEGWSMLGVMANGWTWFRDDAVVAEFDRLRNSGFFDQFKRVVFYGASMGGYGAAAYSAAAKGSTVFVISPQSTLDKEIVPWEMRYKKVWSRDFSGPYGDASISSQSAANVHLMYDPYVAADAAHAARFTGDNVTHWRCPLLGHRLGSSLNQMGILQEIARKSILGELDQITFYKLLRKRHDFPRYQRELANLALDRGRPDLARRVCRYVLAQRNDRFFRKMLTRIANDHS